MIPRSSRQRSSARGARLGAFAWLLVSALGLSAACDKLPLMAPTQSTINLFASNTTLPINGSLEIIATVIEVAGTPVQNGTVVIFTTTLGTIEPREARTQNGKATVRLVAGTESGTAKVRATSGLAKLVPDTGIDVRIGGAAAEKVDVIAIPSTVPAGGGTVEVVAIVTDASGNRLPGVPVTFTADSGTLASGTANTDPNGEARTTVNTNRETKVTARVGGKEGSVTIRVILVATLALRVDGTPGPVGQPTTFIVNVTVPTGASLVQNVNVDFGDGSRPVPLGSLIGETRIANIYGAAGSYTVTATLTDSSGQRVSVSTVVIIRLGPRPTVTVRVDGTVGVAGQPTTFVVSVTVPAGGSGIQNVSLAFGDGQSEDLGALTGDTRVAHTYAAAGTYTVTASAVDVNGQRTSVNTVINVPSPAPIGVNLTTPNLSPRALMPVLFTAIVTPPATQVQRYDWNFGDGNTAVTTGTQASHSYAVTAVGARTVSVTVVPVDRPTVQAQLTINVLPPLP